MKVILVAGKSGSGKSEVAQILKREFVKVGKRVAITGFSKYLKLFACEVLDWDGSEETKPRDFLQDLGMSMRGIHKDYLIRRMIEDFKVYEVMVDIVIVSDVRMREEVERIREEADTFVVRVNRAQISKLNEKQRMHVTENDLNEYSAYDYVIENNDGDLEKKVIEMMESEFYEY